MRRLSYTLVPALLTACPGAPGDTTAGDTTGSTDAASSTTAETTSALPTTTLTSTAETTSTGPTTDDTSAIDPTADLTTLDPTTLDPTTSATTPGTTVADTTTSTTADTTDSGTPGECAPGDVQTCYSGPDGSDGVGACKAGERTCGPDRTWGPCAGEVVPAPETCDEAGDENCDGADPCLGDGAYAWGLTFGEGGSDEGDRVAIDGAGNVVVAAFSDGPIDFGGGALVNAGHDVFLAKFSPAGELLWSKRYGDASYQGGPAYGLATTSAGEIVLAGIFNGAIDFGGGALQNPTPMTDLFLVKLDGDGGHVWSQSFHSGEDAAVIDLSVTQGGDILLAGTFYTALDLGGGPLAYGGFQDAFVAKFTAAGAHAWSRGFGDAEWQVAFDVDADASGDVYVAGTFRGTLDPGSGPLVGAGSDDIFLFKLDAGGDPVWGQRFGDAGAQDGRALAVDSKGRVTLAGATSGLVDFGGDVIGGDSVHSYLAQFDGEGEHLWSRTLCTTGSLADHVAVDGLDNILVTGSFYQTCELGGDPLMALGSRDVFVGKFSPKGQHGWSRSLGGPLDQFGVHIAGSAAGSVAVTGNFYTSIDLGAGAEPTQGGRDGFVVAFDP